MSTYGTMVNRIAREVRRPALSVEIREAIQSAIGHYEHQQFFFNEARATATTVAGQPYYALPSDFIFTVGKYPLEITISSNVIPLDMRTWDYLQQIDNGQQQGIPCDWAYFEEQFRIYPIPDDVYTLSLAYVKRLETLAEDAETNAWMVEGELLIRARAKWDLYTNTIFEFEKADRQREIFLEQERTLRNTSGRRAVSGRIVASYL